MINIELRFGPINGNAISVDNQMSEHSTNPVENKVITASLAEMDRLMRFLSGQYCCWIQPAQSLDELYSRPEPEDNDDIYVVNGEIYLYDKGEYVLATNRIYRDVLYVTDEKIILSTLTAEGITERKAIPVIVVDVQNVLKWSKSYVVTPYSSNKKGVLYALDGWAGWHMDQPENNYWDWSMYSYEGHTHSIADIEGLSSSLDGLHHLAGSMHREIVEFPNFDSLPDPYTSDMNKLYITADTGDYYVIEPYFSHRSFHKVTDAEYNGIVYVDSIEKLLTLPFEPAKVVGVMEVKGSLTNFYVFTNSFNSKRHLTCKEGWAIEEGGAWQWHKYSMEGHTHSLSEMPEISAAIEVVSEKTRTKTYSLDFATGGELVQDVNMDGPKQIRRVFAKNVQALYVTFGDVIRQVVDINTDIAIDVPADAVLAWEIDRVHDGELAAVGVKCVTNS